MTNRNNKTRSVPTWVCITATVLVLLMAAALIISALSGGFRDWSKFQKEETHSAGVDGGAMISPDEDDGSGITYTRVVIPRERYEQYGISPIAETAFTVTATVTGESLTEEQQNVTWGAAAFKNPSSSWATGKSVGTYVTATPNKNQLTVQCLKAFGEQIVIKCTSSYNTAVSKELTVDYKEKIEFTGLTIDSKNMTGTLTETLDITGDRNAKVVGQFSHSDAYTIKGDTVTAVVKITRTSQLSTAVTSSFATRFPEYTVTVTSANPNGTINDFLDKEAHNKMFLEGYPTSFTSANMKTVYDGLNTMDGQEQAHYSVAATVTGASSSSSAQQKSLGSIRLNFAEIQEWYEAFSGINIDFGPHNGGIIF